MDLEGGGGMLEMHNIYPCPPRCTKIHKYTELKKNHIQFMKFIRFAAVEVASALNVDFSHVENAAQGIAKSDRDMHLILGRSSGIVGTPS